MAIKRVLNEHGALIPMPIIEKKPVEDKQPIVIKSEPLELDNLSLKELKALAKTVDVAFKKNWNKEKMLEALTKIEL